VPCVSQTGVRDIDIALNSKAEAAAVASSVRQLTDEIKAKVHIVY